MYVCANKVTVSVRVDLVWICLKGAIKPKRTTEKQVAHTKVDCPHNKISYNELIAFGVYVHFYVSSFLRTFRKPLNLKANLFMWPLRVTAQRLSSSHNGMYVSELSITFRNTLTLALKFTLVSTYPMQKKFWLHTSNSFIWQNFLKKKKKSSRNY